MVLKVVSCGRTDLGLRRARNEDALLVRDEVGLYVVCDGVGGAPGGAEASRAVVAALAGLGPYETPEDARKGVTAGLLHAHQTLLASGGGSTTVAALWLDPQTGAGLVAWVGDSRVYRLRAGVLSPLTSDHSLVQEMIDRGELSSDAAFSHSLRHVITQSIGSPYPDDVTIDAESFVARPGDRYLLCTDGLCGVLFDEEIRKSAGAHHLEHAIDDLIHEVLREGAPDNVTVILVDLIAEAEQ